MKLIERAIRLYCSLLKSDASVRPADMWKPAVIEAALKHDPKLLAEMKALPTKDRDRTLRYASAFEPLESLGTVFVFPDAPSAASFQQTVEKLEGGNFAESYGDTIVHAYGPEEDVIKAEAANRGGAPWRGPKLEHLVAKVDAALPYDMCCEGIDPSVICEALTRSLLQSRGGLKLNESMLTPTSAEAAKFGGRLAHFMTFRPLLGVEPELIEGLRLKGSLTESQIADIAEDGPPVPPPAPKTPDRGGVSTEPPPPGGPATSSTQDPPKAPEKPTEHVPTAEQGAPDGDVTLPNGQKIPQEILQQAFIKFLDRLKAKLANGTESGTPTPKGAGDQPPPTDTPKAQEAPKPPAPPAPPPANPPTPQMPPPSPPTATGGAKVESKVKPVREGASAVTTYLRLPEDQRREELQLAYDLARGFMIDPVSEREWVQDHYDLARTLLAGAPSNAEASLAIKARDALVLWAKAKGVSLREAVDKARATEARRPKNPPHIPVMFPRGVKTRSGPGLPEGTTGRVVGVRRGRLLVESGTAKLAAKAKDVMVLAGGVETEASLQSVAKGRVQEAAVRRLGASRNAFRVAKERDFALALLGSPMAPKALREAVVNGMTADYADLVRHVGEAMQRGESLNQIIASAQARADKPLWRRLSSPVFRDIFLQVKKGTLKTEAEYKPVLWQGRMITASDFPGEVTFQGRPYYSTTKQGTNAKTGKPSMEYEAEDKSRVWRDIDGNVVMESAVREGYYDEIHKLEQERDHVVASVFNLSTLAARVNQQALVRACQRARMDIRGADIIADSVKEALDTGQAAEVEGVEGGFQAAAEAMKAVRGGLFSLATDSLVRLGSLLTATGNKPAAGKVEKLRTMMVAMSDQVVKAADELSKLHDMTAAAPATPTATPTTTPPPADPAAAVPAPAVAVADPAAAQTPAPAAPPAMPAVAVAESVLKAPAKDVVLETASLRKAQWTNPSRGPFALGQVVWAGPQTTSNNQLWIAEDPESKRGIFTDPGNVAILERDDGASRAVVEAVMLKLAGHPIAQTIAEGAEYSDTADRLSYYGGYGNLAPEHLAEVYSAIRGNDGRMFTVSFDSAAHEAMSHVHDPLISRFIGGNGPLVRRTTGGMLAEVASRLRRSSDPTLWELASTMETALKR